MEHFFLIFIKFANQSLIVNLLSLNKDNIEKVRNEITLVVVKNKNKLYLLYNSHICKGTHLVISSVSVSSVTTLDL